MQRLLKQALLGLNMERMLLAVFAVFVERQALTGGHTVLRSVVIPAITQRAG
jgi:hypothetical protein